MSNNNIYTLGIIGIFLSLISILLKILTVINFFNIDPIITSIILAASSTFIFISIYNLFPFTENDKVGCKINLLGIFSIIPILIGNFCNVIVLAIPVLLTFSGLMTILRALSILSSILITLFLFSIYNNSITKNLEHVTYRLTLTCSSCCLVINTLYHISTMIVYNPVYESFINKISFLNYVLAFIFNLLLLSTYKNFLQELILISNSNTNIKPSI